MKKLLADRLKEGRRLTVLQVLAALEARRCDARTLQAALRDLGLDLDFTTFESELRQLERQGLVSLEALTPERLLVLLTERGDLVQAGSIEEPGVARPALG